MFFHAQFSEPELDFLCNDDALLKITVKEGHYNVDTGRASDNASAKEYVDLCRFTLARLLSVQLAGRIIGPSIICLLPSASRSSS